MTMKKAIISAVLAVGMAVVSCSKSGLEAPRRPGEPNGTSVTVALSSASAPAATEVSEFAAETKSSAELTEGAVDGQVHDLWAIQYDKDGNLVGSPYYTADIPAGTAGTAGSGTDYSYDGLSVKLTSSGADVHTVYFVANTHNGSLFTVDNDVSTLDKLKAVAWGFGDEYRPVADGGVVMMGTYTGPVASGTPVTGVRLERLAAKIILKYKSALDGFTVTGIQMKNVPAAFGFADAPAEDVNFPTVADGSHIDYPAENLAAAGAEGDYKTFVWYVPENLSRTATTVTAIGDRTLDKSDGRPTYVEITGVLATEGRVRKAVYRILLGDLGSAGTDFADFNVKRNHIYTVTLDIQGLNEGDNRVSVESYDMSNCAMIQPATTAGVARDSVTFDIRKCLNNGFTTASGLQAMLGESSTLTADVLWQDGNVLNTADVHLDKVNGLLTVKCSKTNAGNAVVALYPDANRTQGTILWSWHIWVTTYSPSGIVKNMSGTPTPNTAYPNASAAGQVHTYGPEYMGVNPGKVIMDRNLGATKSYNGRVPAANDATADQAFGLFYQWGRKDPFPRANGATIDATTAKANNIPIYGPDGTTVLPEDGTGYVKVDISSVGQSEGTSLAYSVQNPLAFIGNSITPFDWYTETPENQNNGLWGDGGSKSAYDPCPKGWRVPPTGTWNDFTRDEYVPANGTCPYYINGGITESGGQYFATNGRFYNNQAWYPAAGDLSSKSGELLTIGSRGYVWSSAISGFRSLNMSFSMSGLSSSITNNRAFGFQIRCVQE